MHRQVYFVTPILSHFETSGMLSTYIVHRSVAWTVANNRYFQTNWWWTSCAVLMEDFKKEVSWLEASVGSKFFILCRASYRIVPPLFDFSNFGFVTTTLKRRSFIRLGALQNRGKWAYSVGYIWIEPYQCGYTCFSRSRAFIFSELFKRSSINFVFEEMIFLERSQVPVRSSSIGTSSCILESSQASPWCILYIGIALVV